MAKKAGDNKGKKAPKNKPTSKKHSMYTISGDKVVRKMHCPRCGPGIFLADRQGRLHCGKCNYTEFTRK